MPTPHTATGPTTLTGKQITSRNAVKHNCTSKVLIVAEERQSDFDALLVGLITEYQPETEMQDQRVSEMARATWELRRIHREWDKSQARLYAEQPNMCEWNSKQQAEADRMARYRTRAERTYNRALQSVECLRTMRLRAEQRAFWENLQLSKLDLSERRLEFSVQRNEQTTAAKHAKRQTQPASPKPEQSKQVPTSHPLQFGQTSPSSQSSRPRTAEEILAYATYLQEEQEKLSQEIEMMEQEIRLRQRENSIPHHTQARPDDAKAPSASNQTSARQNAVHQRLAPLTPANYR